LGLGARVLNLDTKTRESGLESRACREDPEAHAPGSVISFLPENHESRITNHELKEVL